MDWLKDKKNQPFVIGGAAVLIVAAVAFLLFNLGVFNQSNPTPAASAVAVPSRAVPPGAPVATGAPVAAGTPAAALPPRRPSPVARLHAHNAVTAAKPLGAAPTPGKVAVVDETKPINPAAVHDPFSSPNPFNPKTMILNVKQAANSLSLASAKGLVPGDDIYKTTPARSQMHPATIATYARPLPSLSPAANIALPRVAGILFDQGVYAILQPADGQSQSVKPGDTVAGVGRVTSIQSDGVTIKTASGRTVQLPVTSGPAPVNTPNPYPGNPYPGNPYAGNPYGGPPFRGAPYGGNQNPGNPYAGN